MGEGHQETFDSFTDTSTTATIERACRGTIKIVGKDLNLTGTRDKGGECAKTRAAEPKTESNRT